jgi:hypothetical protein
MPKITKKNQEGFTIIEGLLILVIVSIIGGTGWYVYNAHNKTTDNFYNADAANSSIVKYKKKNPDSTANWKTYSSAAGKYSLTYPANWPTQACEDTLLMAGDKAHLGKCNTDGVGQIVIGVTDGDHSSSSAPTNLCDSPTKTSVTVDSVTGTKYSCTIASEQFVGPPAGTEITDYIFYANNKTYVIEYFQLSGAPKVLDDFNTMITKTLKFSS